MIDPKTIDNSDDESASTTVAPKAVSFRALLIGSVLIPVNLLWLVWVEYVRYSDNVSTSALYFNTICLLLLFTVLNAGLGRVCPKIGFSRGELMTIYVMVVISTGLAGHDQMEILFTTIHYALGRATPESGWAQSILPNLPAHLVPPMGDAVTDLYKGGTTLYSPSHYLPWIKPLAWWGAFLFALVWVMLCLTSIFRRQWDAERLTYPIAEIPLQITDPKTQIFKSKLFWTAFVLAAAVRIWVVAHLLYPTLPALPVNIKYYPLSPNLPWSAAGAMPVCFFPFAFGLCFFLPTQISFSCWFFVWLARLELVFAAMTGRTTSFQGFPYIFEQSSGAAIGMALAVLWYARGHLKNIFNHVTGKKRMDDSDEPMPYNLAFWGFLFGLLFLLYFAIHAGMRPMTAVVYMSIFLLIVIVIARLRAEVGLPTIELYHVGADSMLKVAAGDSFWTRNELTAMAMFYFLSRTHRQFPMASHVDAMRIGAKTNVRLRSMTFAIILASAITIVAAFWVYLYWVYKIGYGSAKFYQPIITYFGGDPYNRLHLAITNPMPADYGRMGGYFFGTIFTLFLSAMRVRFSWWPLHPAGYITAGSFGLARLWVPVAVTWLIKVMLLRYGGLKAYRLAIPFFIGLILGEFVVAMIVTIIGLFGFQFPAESGIGGL